MTDTEKAISLLQQCLDERPYAAVRVSQIMSCIQEAIDMLKEQEIMSPYEFKEKILCMFSSIWDCEIDHPVFQDKVGELMDAVVALYRKAVKWDA